MKRLFTLMVALMFVIGCGDKIQTARTVLAFVGIGIQTAESAFKTIATQKRAECLKLGTEGSPAFAECYRSMADAEVKFAIVGPKLEKAAENAAAYIKAAESGETTDYVEAVKRTVCLLVEVYGIIPDAKWKKRLQMYIDMAGAYACTAPAVSIVPDPERELRLLRIAHRLMTDLIGKDGV